MSLYTSAAGLAIFTVCKEAPEFLGTIHVRKVQLQAAETYSNMRSPHASIPHRGHSGLLVHHPLAKHNAGEVRHRERC